MGQIKVITDTDWWMFSASILSGVFAALATLIAVLLSNHETRKQLKQQQEQHKKELDAQNKANKFVIIKPIIILSSFVDLLDKIIIQNNYNRELLLSGEDGFDFFDDAEESIKLIADKDRKRLLTCKNVNKYKLTSSIGHFMDD